MTDKRPFARIAITLPPEDLAAADRLAALQDRSRSWIIAEAVRRYVADLERVGAVGALGTSRQMQLTRDLAMGTEQRLQEADRVAALAEMAAFASAEPRRFASFDDFIAWRRTSGAR